MELRAKYDLSDLKKLMLAHLDAQGFKQVEGSEIELEVEEGGDLEEFELWATVTPMGQNQPAPDLAPASSKDKEEKPKRRKANFTPEQLQERVEKMNAARAAKRNGSSHQAPAVLAQAEQVVEEAVAATVAPFQ